MSQIASITGPTNAALAAHLFGLVAPLFGPDLIMVHSLLHHKSVLLHSLVAPLVGPDLISVHNGSITWSQIDWVKTKQTTYLFLREFFL